MLHAAAQGKPYHCFVGPEARIPFMAMPDAIAALVELAAAPVDRLSRRVYNVSAFSPTAAEIRERVLAAFPGTVMEFRPDAQRAAIVDTWPADIDDSAARTDWGWSPQYSFERSFSEYLLPAVRARYGLK
jgi:nucleoside-diphosphate-sugar epimerase